MTMNVLKSIFAALALLGLPVWAWAAGGFGPGGGYEGYDSAPPSLSYTPADVKDVGITEKLGDQIPLDVHFTDEIGREVRLGDLVKNKPTVLQLGYFECPMLCDLVAQGWIKSIQQLPLKLGDDYQVLSISINPKETWQLGGEKKKNFISGLSQPVQADGVHYLVGSQESIDAVSQAVGFGFKSLPAAGQYSHPAVITVLTPQGKVSHYLYGIEYAPDELRSAIVAADEGRSTSSLGQFIMTCFLMSGKDPFSALTIMRIGGAITVVLLTGAIFMLVRRTNRNLASVSTNSDLKT